MNTRDEWRTILVTAGRRWGWHLALAKWAWAHVDDRPSMPAAGGPAKGSVTLLAHALNTWEVADTLVGDLRVLGPVEEDVRTIIDLGAFLHDAGKQRAAFQEAIRDHRRDPHAFDHLYFPNPDEFLALTDELGLDRRVGRQVLSMAQAAGTQESIEHYEQVLNREPVDPQWSNIIHLADILASWKSPDEAGRPRPAVAKLLGEYGLELSYHQLALVRGLLGVTMHRAMETCFRQRGYLPITFFAHGTVYAARKACIQREPINLPEVRAALTAELDRWHAQDPVRLGARAVGSYLATKVNPLAYAVHSTETLLAFFNTVKAKRFASHPIPKTADVAALAQEYPGADPGWLEAQASRIRAWHGYMIYLVDLLKQVHAGWVLNEMTGHEVWPVVTGLSHTNAFSKIVEIWRAVSPALGDNSDAVHRLVRERVVPVIPSLVDEEYTLTRQFEMVSQQLASEVVYPALMSGADVVRTTADRYRQGRKRAGTPLCVWCGQPATGPAIGAGSEHFLNALEAGGRLGGENKAWVCRACELEQNMRRFATGRDTLATGWYVLPQVQQTDALFQEWVRGIQAIMQQTEHVGRSPLGDVVGLAKATLHGLEQLDRELAQGRWWSGEPAPKRQVERWVTEEFGEGDEGLAFLNEELGTDFESLEEAIFDLAVDPDRARQYSSRLREYLRATAGVHLVRSPWYVLVLAESDLGGREGSESIRSLRRMFSALFLARMFLATVIVPNNPLPPLPPAESRGWVAFHGTLVNRQILAEMALPSNGVPFPAGDRVLTRLAGLILAEDLLKRRAHMGLDALLQAARRSPGQLLQRLALAGAGRAGVDLLTYLRCWNPEIDSLLKAAGVDLHDYSVLRPARRRLANKKEET